MSLLNGLAQYLADLGHGTYSTTTAYTATQTGIVIGALPAAPDRVIGLSTYPGAESSGRLGFDEPRVQIVVRGTTDESTARLSADAIYGQLHGAGVFALTGGVIVNNLLGLQGGPIYVGVDDNNRHLYSINFRVEHRNMTTHRTL